MKNIEIVSKVVSREGEAKHSPSKDISSANLSDYLLKSIWDKVWEIRTDSQGKEYIFGKLPVVTQYGITMYSGDGVDIPSLASGLPFDGRTIWYNPDTQQIEVIDGTGGGSGEGVSNFWDLSGIPSWITNSKPKYTYSEIEGTPDLTKYALVSQIPSLSGYATESWVNQQNYAIKATTLSGYGITDAYTKTNVDDLLKSYVTLGGTPQTITGEKNFTGGLKVNGSPIYYDTEKKYWKLEGDLLVTGGVTMYGNDSSFTPSTIMDAIAVDGTTISKDGGVLKVIGGTGGGVADSVAWANITGKPTFATVATSGKYSDLSGIPSWITNSKPKYTYSEIEGTPDLTKYALASQIPSLSGYATESWVLQKNYATKATTLSGYGITDAYTKVNVNNLLKGYVTIAGTEDVTGIHNFTNGIKVGGIVLKKFDDGVVYIDGNLVVKGGVTMYGDEKADIPTIYDGLPIDNVTIYWENTSNGKVLKSKVGTEGAITEITSAMVISALGFTPYDASNPNGYITSSALNGYATQTWVKNQGYLTQHQDLSGYQTKITSSNKLAYSLISGTPTSLKNPNALSFGSKSYDGSAKITLTAGDLGALTSHQTIYTLTFASGTFASGTFTANSANKTINIPTTTSHISEGSNLYFTNARAVSALTETLKAYVTLGGKQTITGEKNFTGGLKVNGSPIYYDTEKKYWKLEGDLLVTGGVTMYGNEGTFTPSTIMDAIAVDGTTISKSGGVLKVIGVTGGVADSVAWANITGKPTFATVATSGKYSDLSGTPSSLPASDVYSWAKSATKPTYKWSEITSKPTWIGSSKPTYSYSEITGAISTTELQNYLTQNSYLNVTSGDNRYLNLSGGTITGTLAVNENLGVGGAIINKNHYLFARDNANADWIVTNKNWGAEYALIHSGNIGSYNSGSATKIQTARTIWGQSFDGTGNVSGELVLGSSFITGFQGANILDAKSSCVILGGGANAKEWTTYINGYNINFRSGSDSGSAMYINSDLNIGVKTTTPSYNFDVNGTLNATTIYQNGTTLANTYLSLSGGTLASSSVPLYINRTDSNTYSLIGYRIVSKDFGYLGFSNNGDLVVSPNRQNGNTNYYTIWHSGNDGSGSGLDADKLDGVEYQNILERGYSGSSRCASVGWHRIGEFKGTNSNIILLIHRLYGNNAPESYAFSITRVMGTDNYCITQLSGTYSTQVITSIRIDIDWDKNGYIDFYYNTTLGNSVCWTIIGGATAYTAATFNPTTLSVQKTITPIKGFQTSGDILSHGGITMYSMRSLKNVVDERGLSLSELSTIKPTRYTWKDGRDNRLHFGGIADDIQQVLPEVVYSTSDGILTMDYGNAAFAVASSLIQPVVNHEKRIAMLEEENKQLRQEVERLKSA